MKDASNAQSGTPSGPRANASDFRLRVGSKFRHLGRHVRVDRIGADGLNVRELATGAYLSIGGKNGVACRPTIAWMRAEFESGQLIPCNTHPKSGAPRPRRILSIAV